jgi:hypothetical protein
MSDHSHCPFDCSHPQPFTTSEHQSRPEFQKYAGKTFCGACYHHQGLWTEMEPCTPETCPMEVGEER